MSEIWQLARKKCADGWLDDADYARLLELRNASDEAEREYEEALLDALMELER